MTQMLNFNPVHINTGYENDRQPNEIGKFHPHLHETCRVRRCDQKKPVPLASSGNPLLFVHLPPMISKVLKLCGERNGTEYTQASVHLHCAFCGHRSSSSTVQLSQGQCTRGRVPEEDGFRRNVCRSVTRKTEGVTSRDQWTV